MWFKNIIVYQFKIPFTLSKAELEQKLSQHTSRPCGKLEMSTYGWSSPLGRQDHTLVYSAYEGLLICGNRQEKLLPSSVIKEQMLEKVVDQEQQQMRKLSKREKESIQEQVLAELLPRAFSRSQPTYAYIDTKNQWLVIDTSSQKKAEALIELLRKSLGGLSVQSLQAKESVAKVLTSWLTDNPPKDFIIADECELRSPEEEGGIIRCKQQDLDSKEIETHLKAGKLLTQVALQWQDKISLVLAEDLVMKRLKFEELITEQKQEYNTETPEEEMEADFTIMINELRPLLTTILKLFAKPVDATASDAPPKESWLLS